MRLCLIPILFLACQQALAWSDHASLAWPFLRAQPALMAPQLSVEPLEQFLAAEAAGVARVLDEVEAVMLAQDAAYPATPPALKFDPVGSDGLRASFIAALRVSPKLDYALYHQVMPGDVPSQSPPLLWSDLSFLDGGESHDDTFYQALKAGEGVSIAHVLATASDEPDMGMDIGLYTDNGTDFGDDYGMGLQPFGNPNLSYGSQAPLHMGFYHLDWLTQFAQPDLKRGLPLWRITLYDALARLAFNTGHDYWGWRFMGWALHYIGDLTQPYHADPLPGVSLLSALWSVLMGETDNVIQLVSNRHGVLESYQYQRMRSSMQSGDWAAPILARIAQTQTSCFLPTGVIPDLTAGSVALGDQLDGTLSEVFPAQFVSDPSFEWVGSGFEPEVVMQVADRGGDTALAVIDAELEVLLGRFSYYLQGWIAHGQSLQGGGELGGCRT